MKMGMASELPEMLIGPIWTPPSASATPSATPRMITGNDQMMSSNALITMSGQPRKYPARSPSTIDSMVVIRAALTPITRELRPP